MYVEDLTKITEETILSDSLFQEIYDIEDEFIKARIILSIEEKASNFKKKSEFEKLLRAYSRQRRKSDSENNQLSVVNYQNSGGMTCFSGGNYFDFKCGLWNANENGVRMYTPFGEKDACSHPIMPIQILINAETGFCKVKIAFKLKNIWKEVIVDKEIISSASKIVSLSKFGIRVTSENAKTLVTYLSDMEAMNEDLITEQISTSKLGWINGEFIPYGKNVVFDNEYNLKNVIESINECGSSEKWYELIKQTRKDGKFENKLYLVGSFASVLVELVNGLPFVLNLYGPAGKGKTVLMMLAASVWADPSEGQYMADAKATATALEMRLNFLNNLPMFLDDMAQVKTQYDGDFSQLVYLWCSGKGKDRSNRNLGLNASTSWKNIILTNSERSLVNETSQGGAVVRVIDIEMSDDYLFKNGNQVVEVLKNNYGYAGKEFVELIQSMDKKEIKQIQQGYYNRIIGRSKVTGKEKEEKQMLPMSILLTADYLINKFLFRDNYILDFEQCFNILKNKDEVSENVRAYQFIIDEIQMNISRFARSTSDYTSNECWGMVEEDSDYAIINGNAFKKMAEKGNFSEKGFLSWAAKNNLISCDADGNFKKPTRIRNVVARCVFLKISQNNENESEFLTINDEELEKIPFD